VTRHHEIAATAFILASAIVSLLATTASTGRTNKEIAS
jgi:hypothetical protein